MSDIIWICIGFVLVGAAIALISLARRAYLDEFRKAFPDPVIPVEKPLGERLEGVHGVYDPREEEPDYARHQRIRQAIARERAELKGWEA